jgi:hypothetical protein
MKAVFTSSSRASSLIRILLITEIAAEKHSRAREFLLFSLFRFGRFRALRRILSFYRNRLLFQRFFRW